MRVLIAVFIAALAAANGVQAQGLLVPTQKEVPPLALESHHVSVAIDDQVALTRVTQIFRNHTSRALEATYVFPVPKGASVKSFTMFDDGRELKAELVEADKARHIYTDIVRRTQDPGLLEYMGNDLFKVRVFPVPAHGEQKLTVSFTSIAPANGGLIEYVYPLKADGATTGHAPKLTLEATLKAQHPIQSVYSPTHAIKVQRPNDHKALVNFEGRQSGNERDFQLYYSAAGKDVGLTLLAHRADRDQNGYFMLLISPRAELIKTQKVQRDMVFVLDTSGSMAGKRIIQARNALKYCLSNLSPKDRFGLIHFATTVTTYKDNLIAAGPKQIEQAQNWVDELEAMGSTNIDEALEKALKMRSHDASRSFNIVFFTDGQPTIGETNPERIIKNVVARNTEGTRIFTFGVGDDVNAVLLDQLAEKTRSVATYVRENEDIEGKVSGLYAKISHPVLTDLSLTFGEGISSTEVYPSRLPDLFHGNQLVVLGRYRGHGHTALKLTGMVGKERKEFDYEVKFPDHTGRDKAFVEDLWARRKVGYLLDQIRIHGENKETRDEVLGLAKKYGIATPYTSYLIVPDVAPKVTQAPASSPPWLTLRQPGPIKKDDPAKTPDLAKPSDPSAKLPPASSTPPPSDAAAIQRQIDAFKDKLAKDVGKEKETSPGKSIYAAQQEYLNSQMQYRELQLTQKKILLDLSGVDLENTRPPSRPSNQSSGGVTTIPSATWTYTMPQLNMGGTGLGMMPGTMGFGMPMGSANANAYSSGAGFRPAPMQNSGGSGFSGGFGSASPIVPNPMMAYPSMSYFSPTNPATTTSPLTLPPLNESRHYPNRSAIVPAEPKPAEAKPAPPKDGGETFDNKQPTLVLKLKDASAQSGKEGVDLAQVLSDMRNQERVDKANVRQAAGRNCINIGGVWTDDGVEFGLPVVKIKAQSTAYFRMLERHAQMREVFRLGNRVVWLTPSRTVLIIDAATGAEEMSDADIDRLFSKS